MSDRRRSWHDHVHRRGSRSERTKKDPGVVAKGLEMSAGITADAMTFVVR